MGDVKIQWHPAFAAAMDLELAANRDHLIYHKEYNLNTKPLEIDLLVIKKAPEVQMENEIGKLFLGHNIMEYKSPQDHLDIDAFYKAQAYATLYKAYGKTSDERPADDITVSLVREAKPLKLFHYFRKHKVRIQNPCQGIYYVQDNVLFPTQIVVTRELKAESHTWLRALSDRMDQQSMQNFLEQIQELTERFDRELADAVMEVSARANRETVEELRGGADMCKALLEIMEPEINQIVKDAVKDAVDKATTSITENSLKTFILDNLEEHIPEERILQKLQRRFQLSEEKAVEYFEKYAMAEVNG